MALSLATGTYTGDGNDNRVITSALSFQPKVIILSNDTGYYNVIRTDAMSGDLSISLQYSGDGGAANQIQSIQSAGFTVGNDNATNKSGITYRWVALGGTDIATGSYAGNGSDDRGITGVGFSPGFVMINPSTAQSEAGIFRGTNTSGDLSFIFGAAAAANGIQSLDADGFTVGTAVNVNNGTGTPTYYWWAVNSASTSMGQGTYTGNGADNRDITGLGFNPEFVIVKYNGATADGEKFRHTGFTGDAASRFKAGAVESNTIQALGSTSFQVGTDAGINGNTYGFYYWYFRQSPASGLSIPVAMHHYMNH